MIDRQIIYCIVSAVAFIVILSTEVAYRVSLFEKSLVYIPNIQAGATNSKKTGWSIYTDTGLILAEAIPIGLTYIFPSQRVRCVYYLGVFMLVLILTNITKLSYHDPRPYWVDTPVGDT